MVGCSVAYHLAQLGWTDVVLAERKQLTCGTTWHAAGLIAQLRATMNMTRLAKYSQELYGGLEAETGIATGFKRNGSLSVALSDARMEEFLRNASMAKTHGVDVNVVSASECLDMYPYLNADGVVGGLHIPLDGQADPANITMALARGAKQKGVKIFEHTKVEEIHVQPWEGDRTVRALTRATLPPKSLSTVPACGRTRSVKWPVSVCRCMRVNTSTS